MDKKIILFVALESELPKDRIPDDVKVYYTGVGKVNAAIKATEVLYAAYNYGTETSDNTLVLNYGSAGSTTIPKGTLVDCSYFIQQDMNTPFGEKYTTPFDELIYPDLVDAPIQFGVGYVCRTQDKFETKPKGIFDMEAYSIAKVCKIYGFDFRAYKYISDGGDTTDWNENHSNGIDKFLEILNEIKK